MLFFSGGTTTEEEHKLETFGRIQNFSVCCAKANGHGPFHIIPQYFSALRQLALVVQWTISPLKGTLHPKIFSSPKAVNDRWNLSVWGRPSRKVKFLLCARSKSSETGRPAAFIRPQHTPDTPPQRHRSNVSQRAAVG